MLLDKSSRVPHDDDEPYLDLPPSYDNVKAGKSSQGFLRSGSFSDTLNSRRHGSSSLHTSRTASYNATSSNDVARGSTSAGTPSWLSFVRGASASLTTSSKGREVRETVINIVRGLVQQPTDSASAAAPSVLRSCAAACAAQGLRFSSILQEKSIEQHTALYWAIIKRGAVGGVEEASDTLISSLVEHSGQLSKSAIADVRQACQQASNNVLFQRFRYLWPVAGSDAVLLGQGEESALDTAFVETSEDARAFVTHLAIPMFNQRLRVGRVIDIEFIARGRLWSLAVFTWPRQSNRQGRRIPGSSVEKEHTFQSGAWLVSLAILEESAPTPLQGRVLITAPDERAEQLAMLARPPQFEHVLPSAPAVNSAWPKSHDGEPEPQLSESVLDSKDRYPMDQKEVPQSPDDSYFPSFSSSSPLARPKSASFLSAHSRNTSENYRRSAYSPSLPGSYVPSMPISSPSDTRRSRLQKKKVKPIAVSMSTPGELQLSPAKSMTGRKKERMCAEVIALIDPREVAVLEQEGNSYVANDGTLYLTIEMALVKAESSCIIC